MKKLLTLIMVASFLHTPAQTTGDALDKSIKAGFEQIKILSREPDLLLEIVDEQGHSISIIGGRVKISRSEIRSVISQVSPKYTDYVVKLFVAHEIAHQIQFRHYGRGQESVLRECQADLIAG